MRTVRWITVMALTVALGWGTFGSAGANVPYSFHNKGYLWDWNGAPLWDHIASGCGNGFQRVEQVTPFSGTDYAIKAESLRQLDDYACNGDANNAGRFHSEVAKKTNAKEGSWRWYGLAVYPEQSSNSSTRVVAQWMDTNGWVPAQFLVLTKLSSTSQQFKIRYYPVSGDSNPQYLSVTQGSLYDRWHNFAVMTRFRNDALGQIAVYYNGQHIVTHYGDNLPKQVPNPTIRLQTGTYTFWDSTAGAYDWAKNYIDDITVQNQDGSLTWDQVMPAK